ncbi:4a-hydroxytetrahydrobiopterin dehydratase [Streptomyces sp. NPDC005438]|uniref:4a-hydroxytetrahydrobiopterin dehydratase n=1 Tax=Streptomyces sp. NPDC005438 TaxID=3156880 RepID=UPI0033BEC72D
MAPQPLSESELNQALEGLPGWSVQDDRLTRTYHFPGHPPAAAMVAHVSAIQEELGHHADQTLSYNTLTVSVNTHSVGGRITALDTGLAGRIEEIAPGHRAE